MNEYFFTSKKITEAQVKQIINKAGYDASTFNYKARVDGDGYSVTGPDPMALSTLNNAAKSLNITVVIESGAADDETVVDDGGTPFSVTISMSLPSVQLLLGQGYQLYGFKAVQTSNGGGAPTVWFNTNNISTNTLVSWNEQYQAYTSNIVDFGQNTQITASFTTGTIPLGSELHVGVGGGGDVTNDGVAGALSILNETTKQYTCGINQIQTINGSPVATPLCAFPLNGNGLDVIAPIEKILLLFSTTPVNTGTVIFQSWGPGILIDLTGVSSRAVSYDAAQGVWSWGSASWAQQIAANANTVPLLIENPADDLSRSLSDFDSVRNASLRLTA